MSLEKISTLLRRKNFVVKGKDKKIVSVKDRGAETAAREVLKDIFSDIEGVDVRVHKKFCFISSAHPAFLNEVFIRQNEILERVNAKIGKNVLENIYCRASTS